LKFLFITQLIRKNLTKKIMTSTAFTSCAAAQAASITNNLSVQGRVHIIIVVDTSGSMLGHLYHLLKSMTDVIGQLKEKFEGREVTITFISFASSVQVVVPQTALCDFESVPKLRADGNTALHDAIVFVDGLIKDYDGQKIVITITDGEENASAPENSHERVSLLLQGYLASQADPASSVSFILAGAYGIATRVVRTYGLPQTSALNFDLSHVQGCTQALGNMLDRVASGQDRLPSISAEDRLMSMPSDDYDDCLARTSSGPHFTMVRADSGPAFDDDSCPTPFPQSHPIDYSRNPVNPHYPSDYQASDWNGPMIHPWDGGELNSSSPVVVDMDGTPSFVPDDDSVPTPGPQGRNWDAFPPSFGSVLGTPDVYRGWCAYD